MRDLKMRFRGVCVWERNALFQSAIDNFLACLWYPIATGKAFPAAHLRVRSRAVGVYVCSWMQRIA